jgi:hypothetical protein
MVPVPVRYSPNHTCTVHGRRGLGMHDSDRCQSDSVTQLASAGSSRWERGVGRAGRPSRSSRSSDSMSGTSAIIVQPHTQSLSLSLSLSFFLCLSLSLSVHSPCLLQSTVETSVRTTMRAQLERLRCADSAATVVGVHHTRPDTASEAQSMAGLRHLWLLREGAPLMPALAWPPPGCLFV